MKTEEDNFPPIPAKSGKFRIARTVERDHVAHSNWGRTVINVGSKVAVERDKDVGRRFHTPRECSSTECDLLIREFGPMSTSNIAIALGCTRQRVEQIEARAKAKLKMRMTSGGELSRVFAKSRGVDRFSADLNDDEIDQEECA